MAHPPRAHEKQEQQEKAWDLWLNCRTQQDIADELGLSVGTINKWLSVSGNSQDPNEPPDSRQHFDVWSFQAAAEGGTVAG